MSTTRNTIALRLLAAGVVFGSLVAVGCSGDDDDDDAATDTGTEAPADDGGDAGGAAATYTVDALQYSDVAAPAGGTIEIDNSSSSSHTFTADDGAFDVQYGAGETATVDVPAEPGEYPFHCNLHSSMQATLTVE